MIEEELTVMFVLEGSEEAFHPGLLDYSKMVVLLENPLRLVKSPQGPDGCGEFG